MGQDVYFLYVDTVTGAAEDQTCSHRLCEASSLGRWVSAGDNGFETACLTWVEISSCSSRGKLTKWSYFVPTKKGMAVLLKPRPWRYHSFMELSVLFRVRSNMKSMATASLQTRGSMLTNSRWPPRSQIEKVISVLRIDMVFSMKLTPLVISLVPFLASSL